MLQAQAPDSGLHLPLHNLPIPIPLPLLGTVAMHSLPLLDQNAHLVKGFDEAGCQTYPPPTERSLLPESESSTQFDFMSFEDLDNILLGLDATATSIRDDVAAAPPAYSDAVTHTDPSSPLGLGLDRSTLVADPPIRTSAAVPLCVDGTVLRRPDDNFARPQKIDHLLKPVPPGIYMRARPMIWDSISSAATACEAQRLVNEARLPQSSAHPDSTRSGLPPWRRPSIAHVAFQTAQMDRGDVFGPCKQSPSPAPQFGSVSHHHLPRSLTYPPPPNRHPSPYLAPSPYIDPWLERFPSWDTSPMPGTYPPSPPSTKTNSAPSYDFPDTCCSTARCHPMQREGSLLRRTSSIRRECDSCYPSPPPSPPSSVYTDSTYSSPSSSPAFDLHLSLYTPSHSSSALHYEGTGALAHTMHLSIPPPPPPSSLTQQQPSVVNISIALPPPCSSPHQDWLYHRISSLCTILVPLAFAIPIGVYVLGTVLPSSRPPSSSSLLHGPLVWRALSSVLSYVFRTMKEADFKI